MDCKRASTGSSTSFGKKESAQSNLTLALSPFFKKILKLPCGKPRTKDNYYWIPTSTLLERTINRKLLISAIKFRILLMLRKIIIEP